MAQLFTPNCGNGFEELTSDNNDDLEHIIQAIIKGFEQKTDEKIVEKHLKQMVKDGLLRFDSDTGEYISNP